LRGVLVAAALAALPGAYAHAQFDFGFRGDSNMAARFPPALRRDRAFSFCRIMYTSVRLEGERQPVHYVVRLTDDALFECPLTMASDVGTIGLRPDEAEHLRTYLLKGGFLWVDDFWGTAAWLQWTREFSKVLPPGQYPIEDISLDDPIFRAQFEISKVPQITNIGFWRRSGGTTTSERGSDSTEAHLRVIRDAHRRIMVVMTHNTDVADAWEREGEDPGFFYQFSPAGYALGVNVILHAMTH
jgi:hypothetical protein